MKKPIPNRAAAQAAIEAQLTNPQPRPKSSTKHENYDAMSIMADVNGFRKHLAESKGYTLEQWLAMESEVHHPTEFVAITPSPRTMARRRMKDADVPERFIQHVADKDPLDCEPMTFVREFLNSRDGFRVLQGGKGTRKTGSACWALGQLDGGAFIEADDVIRVSIEDKERWAKILAAPLVVFDDLGTEKRDDKATFTSAFSKLLNTVYSQSRRLIITCNVTPVVFRQVYGEREYDRLKEAGLWSKIGGESVRRYDPAAHLDRDPGE